MPQTMPTNLQVSWTMSLPPIAHSLAPAPLPQSFKNSLDALLHWPDGTLAILHQAFQENRSRFEIWNQIPPERILAYEQAAKVYKRGIGVAHKAPLTHSGSYPIVATTLNELISNLEQERRFVICDEKLLEAWPALNKLNPFSLHLTEITKSLESVSRILKVYEETAPGLDFAILGGGVLADTAAFCAALKNKPFTLVPSTLLAMVDACVGGKTGVNFPPFGKNQVGAFAFPNRVAIVAELLTTLPEREIRAGMSEVVKHGLLSSDLDFVTQVNQALRPIQLKSLTQGLFSAIAVKAQVVEKDPTEKNQRASLNLGHTLAHALEAYSHAHSKHILLHGEAVGLGLFFQCILAKNEGYLSKKDFQLITNLLRQTEVLMSTESLHRTLGEPTRMEALFDPLYEHILRDKKSQGDLDKSPWILLKGIGEVVTKEQKPVVYLAKDAVHKAFLEFLKTLP